MFKRVSNEKHRLQRPQNYLNFSADVIFNETLRDCLCASICYRNDKNVLIMILNDDTINQYKYSINTHRNLEFTRMNGAEYTKV